MTDTARFELYAYWRTSATYRVRVAMALKGLAWDEHFVDVDGGGLRDPAFLAINPMGAIPAMIDRDHPDAPPLTQSQAILEFLEDIQPVPPLLPRTPHGRARVRSLASMLTADTHPLIVPRVARYLTETVGLDADQLRAWRTHWFTTGLQAVEKRLASDAETGSFCHGDSLTMADICLASIRVVLPVFKITVPDTPIIDRIYAELEQHPAFAAASPLRQQGAPS